VSAGRVLDADTDLAALFGIELAPALAGETDAPADYRAALDLVALDVLRGRALAEYLRRELRTVMRSRAPAGPAPSRRRRRRQRALGE
jgi:hypothetical protein